VNSSWRRLNLQRQMSVDVAKDGGSGITGEYEAILRLSYPSSNVDFPFYRNILKRLLSKTLFP